MKTFKPHNVSSIKAEYEPLLEVEGSNTVSESSKTTAGYRRGDRPNIRRKAIPDPRSENSKSSSPEPKSVQKPRKKGTLL